MAAKQGWLAAVLALFSSQQNYRVILSIPPKAFAAINELKLMPEDDIAQVIKDAFETHNQVRGAMKAGGRINVHYGATVVPLNLDHLTTPEKRRAGWTVIKGDKE